MFSDQSLKESTKAAAPAFSFAGKHEQKVRSDAPSPNTYNTAGLTSRGRSYCYYHCFMTHCLEDQWFYKIKNIVKE